MRCGDEMRRPNEKTMARRWNAPTEQRNGGALMECTGQKRRRRYFWMMSPYLMEHHLRREELERDDFKQELWLRFNLNLRSKN